MKGIFITVRTGSKRFPKKCLKKIVGKYAVELVIDRAKRSKTADEIVLCTTRLSEDDILREIALKNKIGVYSGSENDKLLRWRGAAEKYFIDFFVTFDGDDLLCDPGLADLAFKQHGKTGADFIQAPHVPTGAFTYGIAKSALDKVCDIKGSDNTENMVPYFTDTGLFKVEPLFDVPQALQRPELRMTMDYPDDLTFFDNIYNHFLNFTLEDAIEYLDDNPEVVEINRHCQQWYLQNQKKMPKAVLK